jgi:DNA-directed RNA polymerase subunit RPC12/RpoP
MRWNNREEIDALSYICGYCGNKVASASGYKAYNPNVQIVAKIYICPHCSKPTYYKDASQIPGVRPGNDVENLPVDIKSIYEESRDCIATSSFTASVLLSRKLLMNIGVSLGAKEGESFVSYIDYLFAKGYIPPNGKEWVHHIRKKGNEANHEIKLMTNDDAVELVQFSEMLLKFIYEFPSRVPKQKE